MSLETGGSPVAGYLSCAAKKGNPKKAAPGAAPLIQGVSLCCLTRQGRLRNSTWQGTHNVPCHGTRTVLAENSLVESNCTAQSQGEKQAQQRVLYLAAFRKQTHDHIDNFPSRTLYAGSGTKRDAITWQRFISLCSVGP